MLTPLITTACCINKVHSTELSEAINSMYRWYHDSTVCIVYLEDVPEKPMMDSGWFDRGWTLQELIAPKVALFHDHDWNQIGTKSDLLDKLHSKTGIPEDVLSNSISPTKCSIAQRMSWAAQRETTRVEDRAYSLLGIFDVSMPNIYGEREKAFLRLQRLISQQTRDESMFAWSMGAGKHKENYSGLYAPSPTSYIDCNDMISTRGSSGYSEMNGELSISLKTYPHSMETYYAILNCTRRTSPDSRVAILLTRLSTENEYIRANKGLTGGSFLIAPSDFNAFTDRSVRIAQEPTELPPNDFYGFWLRTLEPPGHADCEVRILSRSEGSAADKVCLGEMQDGTAGIVHFEPKVNPLSLRKDDASVRWSRIRWIKLGFDSDFNPVLLLASKASRLDYGSLYAPRMDLWDKVWEKEVFLELMDMQKRGLIKRRFTELRPDKEAFRRAYSSEADPQDLPKIFNNRWIDSKASKPGRWNGWPTGVSVLKVDRQKGFSGSFPSINLGVSVKLCPIHSCDRLSEQEMSKQIWVVDVTDTKGIDPEEAYRMSMQTKSCCEEVWTCLGCDSK